MENNSEIIHIGRNFWVQQVWYVLNRNKDIAIATKIAAYNLVVIFNQIGHRKK